MIERLVAWAVARRVLVLLFGLAFVATTALVSRNLEFDALPDVTSNQVLVLTRAPGLPPEEVELRVTRPLEAALGGVPGLVEHRSLSRYGISSITVVFADDVDAYRARQVVKERLDVVAGQLPAGVETPELGPLSGGLGEIFHFTLASPTRTPAELLELAQYRVAPLLREVPGVVEVNTWGGEQRTFDVVADPQALARRRLTLNDLRAALERATGARSAGSVPASGTTQALVRATSFPRRPSDLGAAMVATEGALSVRVADLAEVKEGGLPRIGAATANGAGETVYVMAQMLRGANALEVTAAIHARMAAVRAAVPADVRIDVVYDRSVLVTHTLTTAGRSLIEGGVLVVLILIATLGSWRAGLLVALAIPLSMLGATFAMVVLGIPGNLMSLGAIDFGLVVDGAVVMVEQIFHRLRDRAAGPPRDAVAFRQDVAAAAMAVARPTFFGVLVIGLVYVPVLTLTGVDGKMFRPMALTVVFALATSLILAFSIVPAAASVVLRPSDVPIRDPWLVRGLTRAYGPMLGWATKRPLFVGIAALAALAAGTLLFVRAGTEFAPQLDEGDLVVQTTRGADIDLDTAIRAAGKLEATIAAAAPEVTQVVSRIGSPAVATDIMGLEQADVFVKLRPRAEWGAGRNRTKVIADLENAIAAQDPHSEPSFTQPIQMRFNELLGGAVTDVTIGVYGDDLGELRKAALAVQSAILGVPGVADPRLLVPPDVPVLEVRPRFLESSQLGFTPADVLDIVQAARTGIVVGLTYDGPVRIPIRLRVANSASASDLGTVPIPLRSGGLIPLERVATIETVSAPIAVSHQNGQRRILVGFNVRDGDLGTVVGAARARVDSTLRLNSGYRLVWGGQYETLQAAKRRLMFIVPLVLVLILGVLFLAFASLRPALLISLNIPFACVGGIAALSARGLPVSMSAAVGFIALSGVAVLNGVVLISRVLALQEEGASPAEAAVQAALARVRPVSMTALVAALGFVPMALATGIGSEVQRPLATVVVGGLVTSTLLTLIVLPSLYSFLGGKAKQAT